MKSNWGIIILSGVLTLPAGWLAAASAAPGQSAPVEAGVVVDQIAIRVGPEIITTLEIEEPLRQLRERAGKEFRGEELEKKMREAKEQHVKRLIEEKLLLQEAREQNIEIPAAQVSEKAKQEMEALRAQFGQGKDFEKQLSREHLTLEELRQQREKLIKEQMQTQRLLQGKMQEFSTGAEVADEQLQKYYKQHGSEFQRPARANLSQIFVARPDAGLPAAQFTEQDNHARQRSEQAEAELKAGKDFGAVARKYSEHKASAEKGGEVGWIAQGELGAPELDKAVFGGLKTGETSSVVAAARGFFILRINDQQSGGAIPFEEVRGRIRQVLMAQGSEVRYQAWMDSLKEKYKVVYENNK